MARPGPPSSDWHAWLFTSMVANFKHMCMVSVGQQWSVANFNIGDYVTWCVACIIECRNSADVLKAHKAGEDMCCNSGQFATAMCLICCVNEVKNRLQYPSKLHSVNCICLGNDAEFSTCDNSPIPVSVTCDSRGLEPAACHFCFCAGGKHF